MADNNQKSGFFAKVARWLVGEDEPVAELSIKTPKSKKKVKAKTAILEIAKFYRIKKKYIKLSENKDVIKDKDKMPNSKNPASVAKKANSNPKKVPSKNNKSNKK